MLTWVSVPMASFVLAVMILIACSPDSDKSSIDSPKFQQYYVQGEILYQKHCSNCHQQNGKGLGRLYPPVDQSDFMEKNLKEVICMIKYGKKGSLMVNGVEYNMEMKGNPSLTELEIAELATYMYNNWTHKKGLIDVKEVSTILSACNN